MRRYLLAGDVVASRTIVKREAFSRVLDQALAEANAHFAPALAVPLRRWKGIDELAAILSTPAPLSRLITFLSERVAPVEIRWVLVEGEINLPRTVRDVTQLTGAAFHQLTPRMAELKANGLRFHASTRKPDHDLALNAQMNLLFLLKATWTESQWRTYVTARRFPKQSDVAAALGVTQQTVSRALRAIRAEQVLTLEEQIDRWLVSIYG